MPIPSGGTCASDILYAVYAWKTKSNVLILYQKSKLTFWQLARHANVIKRLLAQENFNLPEKKGTLSFVVNFEKSTEFAKYA